MTSLAALPQKETPCADQSSCGSWVTARKGFATEIQTFLRFLALNRSFGSRVASLQRMAPKTAGDAKPFPNTRKTWMELTRSAKYISGDDATSRSCAASTAPQTPRNRSGHVLTQVALGHCSCGHQAQGQNLSAVPGSPPRVLARTPHHTRVALFKLSLPCHRFPAPSDMRRRPQCG